LDDKRTKMSSPESLSSICRKDVYIHPYRKNSNGVGLLPTNTGSDGI